MSGCERDKTLDALSHALSIQAEAAQEGFDWPDISGVFAKVHEEINEIEHALESGDSEHAKRELGDLLFAVVNLARFLNADPNEELDAANARFARRFGCVREEIVSAGLSMKDCTLDELDAVWEKVKRGE